MPVLAVLAVVFVCLPNPMPTADAIRGSLNVGRILGGALMTAGIVLIAMF